MTRAVPKVFFDANILIAAGKPPGGPEMTRVVDLVDAGMIVVLTTDLTITEVAKKHAENDFQLIKDITKPHVRRAIENATQTAIPAFTKEQVRARLMEKYSAAISAMFERLKSTTLSIDDVPASRVFDAYARSEGFFSGDSKRDQFPDAFIFECIKAGLSEGDRAIIVSNDGDYITPVANESNIELVKSLSELFSRLGLEIEAPDVDALLAANKHVLIDRINEELEKWGLVGDVEDSEIDEVNVTDLEVAKMVAFKPVETGDPLILVGQLEVKAQLSYSHPDWDTASYDSEDKVLMAWDSVHGETDVDLTLDVSILIAVDENDGSLLGIEDISFRNDRFQYVVLHSPEIYK